MKRLVMMRALITAVFLLAFAAVHPLQAQGIKPLGNGIRDTALAVCSDGKKLYVATNHPSATEYDTVRVWTWNGAAWASLPFFTGHFSDIRCMTFYNNELYLAGTFEKSALAIWNGSSWRFDGAIPGFISSTKIYHGKLYAAGTFYLNGSGSPSHLASWDGASWTAVDAGSSIVPDVSLLGLEVYHDQLYMLGSFDNYGMAVWNDQKLSFVKNSISVVAAAGVFQDKLVVWGADNTSPYCGGGLHVFDGKRWFPLCQNLDSTVMGSTVPYGFVGSMTEFDNKLWITSYYGFSNSPLMMWDGFKFSAVPLDVLTVGNYFPRLLTFGDSLMICGNFISSQGNPLRHVGYIRSSHNVSGYVFDDRNNNCVFDKGEEAQNVLVEVQPGTHYCSTDSTGRYEFFLDSGSYSITPSIPQYRLIGCNGTQMGHIKIGSADLDYKVGNISFSSKSPITDLQVAAYGSCGFKTRAGGTQNYVIRYKNTGTADIDQGCIILAYNALLSQLNALPKPNTVSGRRATWNFKGLRAGASGEIRFSLRTDSMALGQAAVLTVKSDSSLLPLDANLADNFDTLRQVIVSSFDPNEKQSYPDGNIADDTKELRYAVHFQNTGEDTAIRVTVVDTVDTNLPLTQISIGAASHAYGFKVKDNVLYWTFNNIMLPPQSINNDWSQGSLNYRARIKPGLAVGTAIINTAWIYFDYQQSVKTNTTKSVLRKKEDLGLDPVNCGNDFRIYPNPAHEALNVYLNSANCQVGHIEIVDITGKIVLSQSHLFINGPQSLTLNVSALSKGFYILRLQANNQLKQSKFVKE